MILPGILEAPTASIPHLEEREDLGPFVYFIRWGEYVKIGTSICPSRRLQQIDRRRRGTTPPPAPLGYPELLACIPGSAHHERNWHHRFKDLRTDGEWFLFSDELRHAIGDAHVRHMQIEMELARNPDNTSHITHAIFFRRFDAIERLHDPAMAMAFDLGEDEPTYHEYYA